MINTYAGIKCAQAKRKNEYETNKQTKNKQQNDDEENERERESAKDREWTSASRCPIAIYVRIFQRAKAQ